MCSVKPSGNGARKVTESGLTYYEDSPAGRAAAAADRNASMGAGSGEEHHPPAGDQPPTDLTDCTAYTDSQWDTGCSKYFKFAHMGIRPTAGGGQLTPAQVACNWQKLCQNILDKVKEQFPALSISSGYRPGPGQSDHGFGRAADIQIVGGDKVAKSKEIFKFIGSSGLPFSQLLFEGNWVHVAYGGPSNAASAVGVARDGKNFSSWHQRAGTNLPADLRWA